MVNRKFKKRNWVRSITSIGGEVVSLLIVIVLVVALMLLIKYMLG